MTQKKEDILAAATTLFSKFGYHAVGVDLIIQNSKVAKMTFYKHFPSKNELIQHVLKKRDEDIRASIIQSIESSKSPISKLKSVFDWYGDWMLSDSFHGCMFIKASEEFSEADCPMRQISQGHKQWFTSLLNRLLIDLHTDNSLQIAKHIVILLEGLTIRSNMYSTSSQAELRFSWTCVKQLIEVNRESLDSSI